MARFFLKHPHENLNPSSFLFLINLFRGKTIWRNGRFIQPHVHIPSLQNHGLRVIHLFPVHLRVLRISFLRFQHNSFREKKWKEEKEKEKNRGTITPGPPCSPSPRFRVPPPRRSNTSRAQNNGNGETEGRIRGSKKRGAPALYALPVNASRVTNTQAMIIEPRFEGETIIIMIILKLEGRRPPANKLRVWFAACAPHSGIGAFDRSVSGQFCSRQRAPPQLLASAIFYRN